MKPKLLSQGAGKSKICAPAKIIAQGAEAKIFLTKDTIIKERTPKSYRIRELDNKIRKIRTRSEKKILEKLKNIISVPSILNSSCPKGASGKESREATIQMQHINGKRLSEHLNKFELKQQKQIIKEIGKSVAKLHKENIAHGDLTTSNMILQKDEVFLIDFGLSFQNAKYEDKAVDIHLFKQALEAKHWKNWEKLYKEFTKSYKSTNKSESEKVLNQLIKVEKRGRYKH